MVIEKRIYLLLSGFRGRLLFGFKKKQNLMFFCFFISLNEHYYTVRKGIKRIEVIM